MSESLIAAVRAAATPGAAAPGSEGSQAVRVVDASAEQLANARAEGRAEGLATGITQGGESMQARIAGILSHAEAKGRETLAHHFAFKTGMSIDDAGTALAAAPKTTEAAAGTRLGNMMQREAQPNPGTGGQSAQDQENRPVMSSTSDIYARRAADTKAAANRYA